MDTTNWRYIEKIGPNSFSLKGSHIFCEKGEGAISLSNPLITTTLNDRTFTVTASLRTLEWLYSNLITLAPDDQQEANFIAHWVRCVEVRIEWIRENATEEIYKQAKELDNLRFSQQMIRAEMRWKAKCEWGLLVTTVIAWTITGNYVTTLPIAFYALSLMFEPKSKV